MKNGGKKPVGKTVAKDLGVAVILALAVSVFASPTVVHETSMQPTIDPDDYLILSRQSYRFGDVERGDIVVFQSDIKDEDQKHDKLLIKRVIGVPGDIITITGGNVYVNGEMLEEDYVGGEKTPGEVRELKVGEDEIFVLGDHRSVSKDSREFGCVSQKAIKGKAVFRFFPFNKFGGI